MTAWTSLNYAVVDVEGNGHNPPDLVELAVVLIVGGSIGKPTNWLIRPDQPITSMARRIHGITNDELVDAETFTDIEPSVLQALNVDAMVAHNAHVDVGVLQRKLGGWECPEVFDTLKLARRFWPNLKSYKLGNLVAEYHLDDDLPPEMKPHRADYDAMVAARLFVTLVTQTYSEPLELEDLRGSSPGADGDEAPTLF